MPCLNTLSGFLRNLCAVLLLACAALDGRMASAAVIDCTFNSGFANGGVIPDGDPSGWQNSQVISSPAAGVIDTLSVQLEIAGGWNGDLYMTLRHETSADTGFAILLNRVGSSNSGDLGYGDQGFGNNSSGTPFQLSDSAAHDVHLYKDHAPVYTPEAQLTGTWKPDGNSLISFRNLDPNGTWTLYAADLNGGDVSTVLAWGLRIETTSVPEPGSLIASLIAGALLLFLCRK